MDGLDEQIKKALSKEIQLPDNYNRIIKNALYKKSKYSFTFYIKKLAIVMTSILTTLIGGFSVYAIAGGQIEGKPALDWLGIKFSDQYIEYKQPVKDQVVVFGDTSVELTSTLCNEGITILEFDVKLSEEDYKKLKVDESVITQDFLDSIEYQKSKVRDDVINKIRNEKYNEEMHKGNYNINPNDIVITEEEINPKYEERINELNQSIEERKNTLFTLALTLNNDQKGGTYNYDKFNPNMEWYANIYVDDVPYYVTSMQKIERISKYEYKVCVFYLITDDITKDKNELKITLKNNKLVNMADFTIKIFGDKRNEVATTQNKSDTWFGNVGTMNMEYESETMKLPSMEIMDLPGEFEVNVSKNDILKDSKIIEKPGIKSEFRNITQTVENVVISPVQTIVTINHQASQQSSNAYGNKYKDPNIEHLPITRQYKVYDANGNKLNCFSARNKNTLIYSDGTREDYDRHDIPNKKYSNATWETVSYLLIENTDTDYIKIVPEETVRNPIDGQKNTGGEIYYEMEPLIINIK